MTNFNVIADTIQRSYQGVIKALLLDWGLLYSGGLAVEAIFDRRFAATVNIRIYLAVYGPEISVASVLTKKDQKTKVVCGLGRSNYPIIDPHSRVVCGKDAD